MNEARVKRLAAEGQVEFTKKMFRRFNRTAMDVGALVRTIAAGEVKDENVFSDPDFSFRMGLSQRDRDGDLVCVQTPDGRTVRVVGYLRMRKPRQARRRTR
jgi:hypothetical protein